MGGLSRVCWEVENEYDSYQTDKKELAWDQAVHTGSDGGRAGQSRELWQLLSLVL